MFSFSTTLHLFTLTLKNMLLQLVINNCVSENIQHIFSQIQGQHRVVYEQTHYSLYKVAPPHSSVLGILNSLRTASKFLML